MIPFDLVFLLWMQPCASPVTAAGRETVVVKCAAPPIPALPSWWRPGMIDRAEPTPMPKVKYAYAPKKKAKKRKRR